MKSIEAISWYTRRLRVMSFREILHRIDEQWFLLWLRLWGKAGQHGVSHSGTYSFCSAAGHQLPGLPWAFELSRQDRTDLLDGNSAALGFDWTWSEDPAVWRTAPDTGRPWPQDFFSSISFRSGNPYGDARVVWEPSRLQQLVALALLARDCEADRRQALDMLRRQLVSWAAANPPYLGIHYTSSMECALRIIATCHALDLVRPFLDKDDRVWDVLVSLVSSHAALVTGRLSRYSSAGNHTIAECAGLVYAGLLFPELDGAKKWKKTGLRVLSGEVRRQILGDGGGIERTLWYHLFVTDLCGLSALLLKQKGEQDYIEIDQAVTRARKYLNAFSDSPEKLPAMGDSDNGYALSRYLRLSWDTDVNLNRLSTFSETGISALNCVENNISLYINHGPLGMPPCYGHGHADCLAVSLKGDGEKLLDNAGTYTYTGHQEWRRYFRGTSAHNTVSVDGYDQAEQQTSFMWTRPYNSSLMLSESDSDKALLLACHDGYLENSRVTHWRGVISGVGTGFVIWDYLDGSGRHVLSLNWHAPLAARNNKEKFSLSDKVDIDIEGGDIDLVTGNESSLLGWMSDMYGIKYPCTTINVTYSGNLPHEFITRIIPAGRMAGSETVLSGIARFKEIIEYAKKN